MKLMAINDQMEMAFSGPAPQVDPVSGNDVPPGSLPEEVRDDIDAKLSEGEYVVPADVLRFHGVKFFEDLRAEAKMGLAGMDAAGRIGGEPVEGAPMDPAAMGISEEDIAMLEQALAGEGVPEAAMAEGGLMDKVAFAAMNDPLVNERINSKGMAVGFAAGGMTQSLYNDPTKIDSLIDQVMTAAQTNPSLLEQLSKRGISINTTQADMQPTEMKQANTQPVELAHGGLTHSGGAPGTTGATPLGFTGDMGTAPTVPTKAEGGTGFNPFQYGLGFSSFGLTNPAGSVPTPVAPAPVGGFTAPAPVAPARPTTGRNSVAVGESYIHPGTGETKTRMPDAYYAGGGRSDQKRALDLSDVDPKAWRSDFNYKNSDELYAQTMEKLKGDVGFIGKIVGKTSIGRIGNAGNLANLQSNIDYLKQRGGTKEQIAALQKAHDDLTIEQLGSLEGGIITGWAQNQLSTESLLADNSESDMVGGGSSSSTTAGQEAAERVRIKREQDKINKEIGEAENDFQGGGYSSTPQTIANQSGRTATDRANEQAQQANAEKKLAKANKAFAKKSGIKDAEDYTVGNKGGLMIKKK
jgi:hypothetical protein